MFERRPLAGQHSLERVFAAVRDAAPAHVRFHVHRLPFESRGFVPRVRNMRYAWRHRGDINHVAGDVHYVALALPRRRTVLTVTDLVGLHQQRGLRRIILKLLWYSLPVRWASQVVTISDWTRSQLIDLIPSAARKTSTIPCPLLGGTTGGMAKAAKGSPVLLQVGTAANKNLVRTIEAIRGLDVHLRIIGALSQEQREALRRCGVDHSNVVGVDDQALADEYDHCDAVVFASTYEGFGLPIIEAQAAGRPVVTSAVASMPEVAGGAAILVDPLSVADIRAGVIRALASGPEASDLIARGHQNVQRFRPASVAASYVRIWEQMAGSQILGVDT